MSYFVSQLPPLPGASFSVGVSINHAGQIAGTSGLAGSPGIGRAVLYQNGVPLDLGTLGGASSRATAINASGQVVGVSDTAGLGPRAFLWSPGGTGGVPSNPQMQDLGTLGGFGSEAMGINDAGQVVGRSQDQGGAERAFLWTPSGSGGAPGNPRMRDLGTLGGPSAFATSINQSGQITGSVYGPGGTEEAFLWTPGGTTGPAGNPQMQGLGTLGGSSLGMAINAAGWVAGATRGPGSTRAFLHKGSSMIDLSDLSQLGPHQDHSAAFALNDGGQVVGYYLGPGVPLDRAAAFNEGAPAQDLNTWIAPSQHRQLVFAFGVNDSGLIVGSQVLEGRDLGYVLTPFEPGYDPNQLRRVSFVLSILAGSIQAGGSGVVLPPGGPPRPEPPPLPFWHDLPRDVRHTLSGLAIREIASLVSLPEVRAALERCAAELVRLSPSGAPSVQAALTPARGRPRHASHLQELLRQRGLVRREQ